MNNLVIRAVAIVSLASMLALVLYLPSAHPPARFMAQIRHEHQVAVAVLGPKHAARIMARMLDMQLPGAHLSESQSALPAAMAQASRASGVDAAMAAQMGLIGQRLFTSPYFRSIDTLLALAMYRISVWMESLSLLLVFGVIGLIDGLVVRVVKSKVFVQHNPEMFALHASLAIVAACASVVACVVPINVHPYWFAATPFVIAVCANQAVANYHRRG